MATSPVIHQLANRNHDDEETSREGRHNFPEKVEGWQNSREDAFLEAAGLTTNQIQTFAFDYNKVKKNYLLKGLVQLLVNAYNIESFS